MEEFSEHYKLYSFSIFTVVILCMVDLASTSFLVDKGLCYEVNPWLEYLMNRYDVLRGLSLFKFPAIVGISCCSLYRQPGQKLAYTMLTVAIIYSLVLIWHLFIICHT